MPVVYSSYNIESNNVNLGFIRDLGTFGPGPLKGRMNLGYSHYLYTDTTVDNYRATVGLSSDLHEKWNFLIDAGVRRTDTNFTVPRFGPTGLVFAGQDGTGLGMGIDCLHFPTRQLTALRS